MKYSAYLTNEMAEATHHCRRERKRLCFAITCVIGGLLAGLGVVFMCHIFSSCLARAAGATAGANTSSSPAETNPSPANISDPYEGIASSPAETNSSTADKFDPHEAIASSPAETNSSTADKFDPHEAIASSPAQTNSSTADKFDPHEAIASSPAETNYSAAATDFSDPHEAIAREWRNLRHLGCQPTVISVDVLGLLGPRDDLQDKDFSPKKLTVRRCLPTQSFCEAKGHACVPSEDGVRKKKFALEFREKGETQTRWRETTEEVACECRPFG